MNSDETISIGSSNSYEMEPEEWINTIQESVWAWMDDHGERIIHDWLTKNKDGLAATGHGGKKKVKAPPKKEGSFFQKGKKGE